MRLLIAGIIVAILLALGLPRLTSGAADPKPMRESAGPEPALVTEPLDGGLECNLADSSVGSAGTMGQLYRAVPASPT